MRKRILGASLIVSLVLLAGCGAKPQAAGTVATKPDAATPRNPVIVHVVSQSQTITISSSPQGLLYSLKDADGRVQIADATTQEFAELRPELYQQIKHYIAVHADDAPLPEADAGLAPVPTAINHARE